MPLTAGTSLGPYEIVTLIGAGGMGEVYRARDTRLDRTVALKVLPPHLAENPELRQRFQREAKAISALNHPHICVLHDVGRQDGIDFLVMEYLEGQTLATRLKKGALPLDLVLRHGIEIAEALDRAHRQGIVHRDLKPGNVMLTKGGAKLLDFGLAKLRPLTSKYPSELPTQEEPLTAEGRLVGTLPYMAPEQLQGQEPDARTDLFAMGAMLYEMTTGRRAFAGPTQADLVAAILSSNPPPPSTLRPGAPSGIDRVVSTCLAKDPDDRWQNAHDLATELRWVEESGSIAPTAPKPRRAERLRWMAALFVATTVGIALGRAMARPGAQSEKPPPIRFDVRPPDEEKFSARSIALSPNGDRVAFRASAPDGRDWLYVRALDSLTATRIPATEQRTLVWWGRWAPQPVWSPDGRQIAFGAERKVKKLDLSSGRADPLCDDADGTFIGGSWGKDGTLILALGTELLRMSAEGGEPKPLGKRAEGEIGRYWPQFLPDGRHYLYLSLDKRPEKQGIYVASLDSEDRRLVVRTDYNAAYASGHLLFVKGRALVAQRFEVETLTLSGDTITLSTQLSLFSTPLSGGLPPEAVFSVSESGVLAWRPASPLSNTSLTWFDRAGRSLGTLDEPAVYSNPALAPDDGRLAVDRLDPETQRRDIWIFDLSRASRTRLTFDPADDFDATWSPDGTRIIFTSDRRGQREIYRRMANGSGSDELLLEAKGRNANVEDWSLDGSLLLFNWNPGSNTDLFVLPLSNRDPGPVPFLATEFAEDMGQFSPDRRFVAYRSLESGRSEVYVRDLSSDGTPGRGKWQVSTDGGSEPRWRRDGKELFYVSGPAVTLSGPGKIQAVGIKTDGGAFGVGAPKSLFEVRLPAWRRNRYVVTRDGERFLVNVARTLSEETIQPIEVTVNGLPSK